MQEERKGRRAGEERRAGSQANTRPQQGGEAETTRFGMEEGDNTDVPATGGPTSEQEPSERSS